jgi:2-polyprenyl-3-methyl-5-hydroxy-6-metoxy-1,4-benzoquinol methylase
MNIEKLKTEYPYDTEAACHTHAYLWSPCLEILGAAGGGGRKVFDLGCGNGTLARHLKSKGYEVTGVDPSSSGIAVARRADPSLRLDVGSAYEPLANKYGTFPAVVSLEVVEHVYDPRLYAKCVADLLQPGGTAIISTPYHSYFKNLVMAVSGKMDAHFTALWDHGHIKFWSVKTLTELFAEQGLRVQKVLRVGRIPVLAKSMILVFVKA